MQKLAEVCIRRPVFAAMIVLSLVVVGASSFFNLGVDRFPSVDLPTVSVRVSLPGASAEEIESQVTQPLEEVVNTVAGIDQLRSISSQGQSPVMSVALTADRSIRELTELADKVVKVQLERAGGVGEVFVVGGLNRAINVWIDSERLAAYKIPITQVRQALVRQNADVPGGLVDAGRREMNIRTLGRYSDPRDFNELVVANINGAAVRLKDVGRAEDTTKEQRAPSRPDGG